MRFLMLLAGGVFAIGGLALCVWISLTSVPAAFVAMAGLAAMAITGIGLIARHERRATTRHVPTPSETTSTR
jgi:hypothetical protein